MYAIIATGGKQYKVSEGDIIDIEKIEGQQVASSTKFPREISSISRRSRARVAQRSLLTRSSASAETP